MCENHLLFNRIMQKGSGHVYLKAFHLRNWSEIQCKTYVNTFEMVGEAVLEKSFDFVDILMKVNISVFYNLASCNP